MLDCFRKTLKSEGLKGFYKGTLMPLFGVGACVSIQFAALESMKRVLSPNGTPLSLIELYLAGAASGIANSVLSCPIEHVRTRLQVQTSSGGYNGPIDLVRKVYRQYGIGGVFKGVTLIREIHGYGIYFLTYEYLMQRAVKKIGLDAKRSDVPFINSMIYGATSGYALWLAIYPIDAIKSKIQTDSFDRSTQKFSGILDCARKTFRAEGMRGFYRGFWPCMLRCGPCNGATFLVYESIMNIIAR